ncbi:30S ribosomal protein S8 [Ureaplasma ceti]|uniref:Small ribosomal subunit protein uS8 n=1 Tax=Ureaplasma ceti TaxID=3119530 RepID=A0ABP9UBD4_9BACT
MHLDPIAELLTKIRNAKNAHKPHVTVATTNMKSAILSLLEREGYIRDFEVKQLENNKSETVIRLKYNKTTKECSIHGLRQISKPGLRVYAHADELPKVINGLGVAIISTSKGILTDKQARELNVGGEVIAFVW